MFVWPPHFPTSCPPAGAIDLKGTVFRFINGRVPVDKDFLSHYEREPDKDWGDDACRARGLSVLRTWADCVQMRKGVPALRKKKLAIAEISTKVGPVATTPSNNCGGHRTWWRHPLPQDVRPLFSTFDEPQEAGDE